eukprot:XP_011669101.1 PREDICTED: serine/threonine-protein phosphatase 6 regulatory ankyrin repeat subunit B-like [Strongylocentrotus purpuratus]
MTALHLSAMQGHLDVIKYLISQGAELNKGAIDGAEVNKTNGRGETALRLAAQDGHLDITRYLISQGAGHLDVIKYLISQGAEVNNIEDNGMTALHASAQEGHLDVTKYLIGQGDEVNKGGNADRTALHYAAQQKEHVLTQETLMVTRLYNCLHSSGINCRPDVSP